MKTQFWYILDIRVNPEDSFFRKRHQKSASERFQI